MHTNNSDNKYYKIYLYNRYMNIVTKYTTNYLIHWIQ